MPMTHSFVRPIRVAVIAGVVLLGMPSLGQAQFTSALGWKSPMLNRTDLALANAAAQKLLNPRPAPLGTTTTWSNSASGNSGTLTMGRAFQKGSHDCRTVSWHDVFRRGGTRTLMLDTCRISGRWKLS